MSEVTLFQTGFRMDDSALQPGDIFRKADGTVWLVNPDSSQTQITGGGEGSTVYQQEDDPGAVGAGSLWVNTTSISGTPMLPLLIRNTANDGWIPAGLAIYDGSGTRRAFVTLAEDGGITIEGYAADGTTLANNITLLGGSDGDGGQSWYSVGNILLESQTGQFQITCGAGKSLTISVGGIGSAWSINGDGAEVLFALPAPDDGDVGPGQLFQWLDDTVDAPAHRFKGQDGDGNPFAGLVAALASDFSEFTNVEKQDLSSALTVADVVAALVALGLATS